MPEYVETIRLVVDSSDLDRALADIQRKVLQTQNVTVSSGKAMSSSMSSVSASTAAVGTAMGGIGSAASLAGGVVSAAARGMEMALGGVQSAAGLVGKALSGVGSLVTGAGQAIGSAFSSISTAATIAVGAVTATGIGLAKTGLGYIDLWQRSVAAWTTILGSADKANSMMNDLAQFSSKMPFGRQTWIEATQQLLGFGVAAEDVIPALTGIGNAVAASTGKAEDVQGVTRALAVIKSTGKITADTLNQLGTYGINAAQIIGDQFGKTAGQVREAITKGTLSGDKAFDALVRGMTRKFDGAGANVSKTFGGMLGGINSRLRDFGAYLVEPFVSRNGGGYLIEWGNKFTDILSSFNKFLDPFMKAFVGQFAPSLDKVAPFMGRLLEGAQGLASVNIKDFVDELGRLSKFLAPVAAALLSMGTSNIAGALGPFGALLPKINPLVAAFAALALSLPPVRKFLGQIAGIIIPLAQALGAAFTGDVGALGIVGDLLEQAFGKDFANNVRPTLQWLMDSWPKITKGLGDIGRAISKAFTTDPGAVGVVGDVIEKMFGPKAAAVVRPMLDLLMQFLDWVKSSGGWIKVLQNTWETATKFISTEGVDAFRTVAEWIGPKLKRTVGWFADTAWPAIQQAMMFVMSFIVREVVPKLMAVVDWLYGPEVQRAITWVTETAWPNIKTAIEKVVAYIDGPAKTSFINFAKVIQESLAVPRGADNIARPGSPLDVLHKALDDISAGAGAWHDSALLIAEIWHLLFPPDETADKTDQINAFSAAISGALSGFGGMAEGFRTLGEATRGALTAVRDFIVFWQNDFWPAMQTVVGTWDALVADWKVNGGENMRQLGLSLMQMMLQGILDWWAGIQAWVEANIKDPFVEAVKTAFDMKSPSRLMADLGVDVMQGFLNGMLSKKDDIAKVAEGIAGTVGGAFSGLGSSVQKAVGGPGGVAGAATDQPAPGEIADYIRQSAAQRGIDPETAVAVANTEGGTSEAARRGTFATGSSWWPFQLHYGGAGTPYEYLGDTAGMGNSFTADTGFQPGDPTAWKASTDYALDQAAKYGWGQWYGAAAHGIGNRQGIPSRDDGGWLMPGISTLRNDTGQPERILAPGQSTGGFTVNLGGVTINAPGGDAASLGAAVPAIGEEIAAYIAARLGSSLQNQRARA